MASSGQDSTASHNTVSFDGMQSRFTSLLLWPACSAHDQPLQCRCLAQRRTVAHAWHCQQCSKRMAGTCAANSSLTQLVQMRVCLTVVAHLQKLKRGVRFQQRRMDDVSVSCRTESDDEPPTAVHTSCIRVWDVRAATRAYVDHVATAGVS